MSRLAGWSVVVGNERVMFVLRHPETEASARVAGSGRAASAVLRACVALCALLFVAGCSVLSSLGPDPETFDLTTPSVGGAQPVRRGTQILIAEPAALRALDSENIVVETSPLTIEYLGGSQWGDRLPRLVQRRLAAAFESSDRFAGVGLPGQGLAIDYQVVTEIRDFGIDAPAGAARVEIAVKLLNDRNGAVVADRTFSSTVPVAIGAPNGAYVAAIDAAFSAVADDMVVWVTRRI